MLALSPSVKCCHPKRHKPREAGTIDADGNGFIHSMCEMCVWRCGLIAKVKDGRVVKLDGNPEHPHSRGNLCPRGQSGLMNTYDPDRVLTPLIRVGKRGEGIFRQASWDEALDIVAKNMLKIKEKYGPEAMVFSSTHNLSQPLFENLLYAFGSPNYGTQRSLCFNAMIVSNLMTYGMEEPARIYDEKLKYILLTGRNLLEAISTSETSDLSHAIDRGAKVVYLDPRFTKTAAKATEWLPIKPGMDLAFHLALLNIIIGEKLYNSSFVAKNTIGFDELKKEVARYTPEWAAPLTGIPAETIKRIAHEFAAAAPHALAHNGWRTSNFVNSFHTQRAIGILNALIGNWDVTLTEAAGEESGILGAPSQPPYPRVSALRLDGVPWKYPVVPLKIGVFQELRDNIVKGDPYQAHGWFISRQNPIMSIPDRGKTLEAFGKMDFIVTVDIISKRYCLVLGCYSSRSILSRTLRSACSDRRQDISPSTSDRTTRRGKVSVMDLQTTWVNDSGWAITSNIKTRKIICVSNWHPWTLVWKMSKRRDMPKHPKQLTVAREASRVGILPAKKSNCIPIR